MQMWFNITSADYAEFCSNNDATSRTAIAKSSFQLHDKFCSSKAQLLCDLAYQALDFCASSQLDTSCAATLLVLISNELNELSHPDGTSENRTPVERYKEGLNSSRSTHGDITPADSKKLMQFFADRVLRIGKLYKYVLHHLPTEEEKEIRLEISSPTPALPLAESLPAEPTE